MDTEPSIGMALMLRHRAAVQQQAIREQYARLSFEQTQPRQIYGQAAPDASLYGKPVVSRRSGSAAFSEILAAISDRLREEESSLLPSMRPIGQRSHLLPPIRSAVPSYLSHEADISNEDIGNVSELPYADLIVSTARSHGISPHLVAAVVKAESGFNPLAQSRAGAKGLMQLMDGTARTLGVSNVFDPAQNIEGGVRFLSSLLRRFNGDPKLALAAYNAGPGAVEKYGGIPPYRETRDYVAKVLNYWRQFAQDSVNSDDTNTV